MRPDTPCCSITGNLCLTDTWDLDNPPDCHCGRLLRRCNGDAEANEKAAWERGYKDRAWAQKTDVEYAVQVPRGYRLVPVWPTDEMYSGFASVNCISSGVDERFTFSGDYGNFSACYRAMLDAYRASVPYVEIPDSSERYCAGCGGEVEDVATHRCRDEHLTVGGPKP